MERLSEGLDGDGREAEKEENTGKQHSLGVLREGWEAAILMPHGMSFVLPVVARHCVPWHLPEVGVSL